MEGYSVDEAATVLGVPTGRVWELLARGVLAGTQEDGAGMRVYLRARSPEPAAVVEAGTAERGATANGNGGHGDPAFEASPFRELLNEFRNLTERYGQALLALGEARGEVAGLRARVELLEARLDLRLPGPPGWASPWAAPEAAQAPEPAQAAEPSQAPEPLQAPEPAQAVEPAEASEPAQAPEPSGDGADAAPYSASSSEAAQAEGTPTEARAATHPADENLPSPPQPDADHEDKAARRPHRRRHGSHSAVAGIAEALARAEDPTVAPLPGAEEAAEALAALREEINQGRAVPLVVEGPASSVGEAVDQVGAPQAVAPSTELPAEELEGPMAGPTESVAKEREAVSADAVEHEPAPSEAVEMPGPTEVPASAVDVTREPLAPAPATLEPEPAAPEAVEPEPLESTAVPYSSEWDEPDWIAEEDLDGAWEAPQPAAEETEVHATEPPTAEIELAEAAEPEAAEAELVEAITPLTAEPAAAEAELVEAIIPHTAEPAEAAEPEAAEAEPMATITPVTAEPAWEERPEERQLSEMAAWPPPPEEELAAEMEIETALPAAAEPEASAAPAADDYLLLYEPAELAAVSQRAAPEPEPEREPEPEPAADALEEELMWLGDEFRPSTSAWSGLGQAGTPASPSAPLTDEPPVEDLELERLARLRGWDENELSAIRSLLGDRPSQVEPARATEQETRPPDAEAQLAASGASGARAEISLPGADELDEAMAALGGEPEAAEAPEAPTPGEQVGTDAEPGVAAPPAERETSAPSPAPRPVSGPPSVARMTDEDWLRGRRGPAANAYRRLRRLFPS